MARTYEPRAHGRAGQSMGFMGGPRRPRPEGMPSPKGDVMVPVQNPVQNPADNVAASASIGETPNDATMQPGNRRSIREYLEEINTLKEQMRAQGIAEDQLPVPTFTNIQYGPLDQSQGYLGPEGGGAAQGREVRSHVDPEWIQSSDPNKDLQYGPANVVTQGAQKLGIDINEDPVSNVMDPNLANSRTSAMFDEIYDALREKLQREPTPEQFAAAAANVRMGFMNEQAKQIDEYQKIFKNAGAADLWESLQTGDWSKSMKALDTINTPAARQKRQASYVKDWQEIEAGANDPMQMKPLPVNPDTGVPYQSGQEYIDQQMTDFDELMGFLKQKAASQSGQGPAPEGVSPEAVAAYKYYMKLKANGVEETEARKQVNAKFLTPAGA